MPETPTIQDAARLLMARWPRAARELGRRTPASPIYQDIYNTVAVEALGDARVEMTPAERDLVARFISLPEEREARTYTLRVRLTDSERADLQRQADAAGMEMSEYVRSRLFG